GRDRAVAHGRVRAEGDRGRRGAPGAVRGGGPTVLGGRSGPGRGVRVGVGGTAPAGGGAGRRGAPGAAGRQHRGGDRAPGRERAADRGRRVPAVVAGPARRGDRTAPRCPLRHRRAAAPGGG